MIKQMFAMLLMVLLTIIVLVSYQWVVYDLNHTNQSATVQDTPLNTEIRINHREGILNIEQEIRQQVQAEFWIHTPNGLTELNCRIINNDEPCQIVVEGEKQKLTIPKATGVIFTYSLPLDTLESEIWLKDWFVQFSTKEMGVVPMNFEVMLAEENKTITWVASAHEKGKLVRDNIVYYVWFKENAIELPFYMTESKLYKFSEYEPNLVIYSAEPFDSYFKQNFQGVLDQFPEQNGLTIVKTDTDSVYHSSQLIIAPSDINTTLMDELILSALIKQYNKPSTDEVEWVWNVLPAIILERPVGSEKVQEMSTELISHLLPEQRLSFKQWLLEDNDQPQIVSTEDLDQQLVVGEHLETSFFTLNQHKNKPMVPFFYVDTRSIIFENIAVNTDWHAIVRKQQLYFPLLKTMDSLDFNVTVFSNNHSFLITKAGNSWRLYLEKPYYIYNQEDYGLINKPFETLEGNIYISEKWIEQVMKIEVIKRKDGIYLLER